MSKGYRLPGRSRSLERGLNLLETGARQAGRTSNRPFFSCWSPQPPPLVAGGGRSPCPSTLALPVPPPRSTRLSPPPRHRPPHRVLPGGRFLWERCPRVSRTSFPQKVQNISDLFSNRNKYLWGLLHTHRRSIVRKSWYINSDPRYSRMGHKPKAERRLPLQTSCFVRWSIPLLYDISNKACCQHSTSHRRLKDLPSSTLRQ